MAILLCHNCAATLTPDERVHYVIECHACVLREHDLWHAVARDSAHPDAAALWDGPVEIARQRPPGRRPAAIPARRRIAPARARV